MWAAKFRRAPGNHSAPGIVREPSTRSYGVSARISKKSQIDAQKPSRSVTDQRQSSWKSAPPRPTDAVYRASSECSRASSVGVQTTWPTE